MNVAETRLCLLLHGAPDIEDDSLARLLLHCGSARALADCDPAVWRELELRPRTRRALTRTLAGDAPGRGQLADARLAVLQSLQAFILPICDPRYPPLLRTIYDPPPLLYVRGDSDVLLTAQLAVVGSRKASPAGLRAAESLAGQVVLAGLNICSGLALGIDGAAHRGALRADGKSVAVMATGIDRVYPAPHRGLAAELERAGCLVTEFPLGTAPVRFNFPRRNRIISGLSLGVLVVEAALPSGSLITARTALEQGREVFALPWSIYHPGGAGCLRLIRDGAKMVEAVGDVIEELGPLFALQQDLFDAGQAPQPSAMSITREQARVLALVGYERIAVDDLVQHSALPVARVLAGLSALELEGLIERSAGGYIRC